MENLHFIGTQIKKKRLSLNMTMEVVAKKAGITRMTLFCIEKGDTKCSLETLLNVLNVLNLKLVLDDTQTNKTNRLRASRINTAKDKKINRFLIMCIEQYCEAYNAKSSEVYKQMVDRGIIEEFKRDYEDLHGMSTSYINEYLHALL